MNFFSKTSANKSTDAKLVRDHIIQDIRRQFRKLEGGEARSLRAIHLFISCTDEERHMYESALYTHEGARFKTDEIQKLADDYAIDLPDNWELSIEFTATPPSNSRLIAGTDAYLFIETKNNAVARTAAANITILNGEAEKEVYSIHSGDGKINIGSDKKAMGADGFFRINHIAFHSSSSHESNKFISRFHAHIEFDNESGSFVLYADEGGVPPRNKVKVRSVGDKVAVKLLSTQTGHRLKQGDQIMLGDSAVLEFTYTS